MTSTLHHLVYQSVAVTPFSEAQLQALLTQSHAWNSSHGLTGLLLYSQGELMQVLEGSAEEIQYIFGRISGDTRHANVTKLSDGPIAQRSFAQWSMGFKTINPQEFARLKGYLNTAQPEALARAEGGHDPHLHSVLTEFLSEEIVRF